MADEDLSAAGTPPATLPSSGTSAPGPSPWRVLKVVLWLALAVYVLLFVLLNRAPVEVSFVFYTATVPLVVVLLGVLVAGILLALGGGVWRRRRANRAAARRGDSSAA